MTSNACSLRVFPREIQKSSAQGKPKSHRPGVSAPKGYRMAAVESLAIKQDSSYEQSSNKLSSIILRGAGISVTINDTQLRSAARPIRSTKDFNFLSDHNFSILTKVSHNRSPIKGAKQI
jgi:hypothetical protein